MRSRASVERSFVCLTTRRYFWKTILYALQAAAIVTLGRIFDKNSVHNLPKLLRLAEKHSDIFSKGYKPRPSDFRRLEASVDKRQAVYDARYLNLRHKMFAHKGLADASAIEALFANTNFRELQRIFAFLTSFHEALWQWLVNGRKPVLRPVRYSLQRMRAQPTPAWRNASAQEHMVHEVERFLMRAATRSSTCLDWSIRAELKRRPQRARKPRKNPK